MKRTHMIVLTLNVNAAKKIKLFYNGAHLNLTISWWFNDKTRKLKISEPNKE